MFGPLGFQEVLLILVVALLIFGPRKLPEIGRTIGRTLSEFRKASTDLKRSLNAEIADEELRQSDPRKLVRETYDEVRALKADLTKPFAEPAAVEPEAEPAAPEPEAEPAAPEPEADLAAPEPEAEPAAPEPEAEPAAVSRGSISASGPEPEPSTSQ